MRKANDAIEVRGAGGRRALLSLLALLSLVLSACGGGAGESAGGAGAGGQDQPAEAGGTAAADGEFTDLISDETVVVGLDELEPPPPVPEGALIGAAFPHFKDPYWIAEAWGVQQRADELGVDVQITAASGYGDTTTQISQVESFMTQGAQGMVVGAVDATAMAPTINQAWQAKIPVAFANSLAESEVQIGVYTNDCQVGELQAEHIAEQDPDAKIVMFTGPAGVAWPAARSDCFKEKIAELAPDAEILTEKFHDMDRAVILETMNDVIQTFPEIDYVYNNTDLQAKGVVDALRGAGYGPDEVAVTTLTIGREAFELLEAGWIDFALAERPVLQGALALDMVLRLLAGEEVAARWAVEHPGFTSEQAQQFLDEEAEWNWEPEDYRP